jgi:hypothetical protein
MMGCQKIAHERLIYDIRSEIFVVVEIHIIVVCIMTLVWYVGTSFC